MAYLLCKVHSPIVQIQVQYEKFIFTFIQFTIKYHGYNIVNEISEFCAKLFRLRLAFVNLSVYFYLNQQVIDLLSLIAPYKKSIRKKCSKNFKSKMQSKQQQVIYSKSFRYIHFIWIYIEATFYKNIQMPDCFLFLVFSHALKF